MSARAAYRGLVLDLDGTLVDSHAYTFAAFRYACRPFRQPPDDSTIYAAFGPDESVILAALVGTAHAPAAAERLQRYYIEHVDDVRAHARMVDVLRACRDAGVPAGLFTGRGREATQRILEALDLESFFVAVYAGDDGAPKPAPDGVRALAEHMRRTAREVLVVGDSPLDMESAQAAGAAMRLATWYARGVTRTEHPAPRIDHPDALRALLGLPARA